ncbi:hypothetical protein [Microvirga pudoricolor]|uniref:hypothetical protein n=1 Tax=Microvirga pudoricolor TaxID=2778729 RepID=UPI001951F600|nr:hypothetical protein [Microvirga pudoricolor]MBM6596426.1 hypothetical protein [Microvirga pudoricolor]
MIQITLPLVWFTIRVDVVQTARRRFPKTTLHPPSEDLPEERLGELRSKFGPRLLRDMGLDESGRD